MIKSKTVKKDRKFKNTIFDIWYFSVYYFTWNVYKVKIMNIVYMAPLAKMKKVVSWHFTAIKFIGEEQLVQKVQIYFKNYDFCVKFGAISWKCDILSITALSKFESKSESKKIRRIYETHNCDYLPHTTFLFYLINFHLNIDFPSQFCIFYRKIT